MSMKHDEWVESAPLSLRVDMLDAGSAPQNEICTGSVVNDGSLIVMITAMLQADSYQVVRGRGIS